MQNPLRPNHQVFVEKFVQACQADVRVVAAFLLGSYVNGSPDEHSDLDLCILVADDAYDDFVTGRDAFILQFGKPLFQEDFDIPGILFLIFSDGSEVEVNYARESTLKHFFTERFDVLLDKKNITNDLVVSEPEINMNRQMARLQRLTYGFWHDFSHFTTALARSQLWWAQGQLEFLRSICVGLARLRNDFSDTEVEGEVYFKIEKAMPVDSLAPLRESIVPMEKESMQKAGLILAKFYKDLAEPLAREHGIEYPRQLEELMIGHLMKLSKK